MNTKPLFKALGLVFALLLVFTFSACSDDDTGGGGDTTAPTWTATPVVSGTPTTNAAAIGFTLNEAGTVFYVVRNNGVEPPSSSQVTNDNNFVLASAGVGGIINLTGLTADTAYDVFVVAKDTAGNLQAAPVRVDVLTASNSGGGDSTAPAWTADPAVFGTPETNTAYVAYTLDEECTVHYVVLPNGATAPSAADVKTNGNRTYNSVGVQDQVYLQDLSTGTTYNVYFVATDAANNDSVVKMAVVTTASGGGDTTPPSWSSAPALSGSATTNAAAIVLTTDEDSTVYYQILADGSPAPTSVYLRDNAPNIAATGGSPATINLTGLTAGTAYDVYIVARDASGNLQASPTLVEFTTASGGGTTWAFSGADMEGTSGENVPNAGGHTDVTVKYSDAEAYSGSTSMHITATALTSNRQAWVSVGNMNDRGANTKLSFYVKGDISNATMVLMFGSGATIAAATPAVNNLGTFTESPFTMVTSGTFTYANGGLGVHLADWTKVTVNIPVGFDTTSQPLQLRAGRATSTDYSIYFDHFIFEP